MRELGREKEIENKEKKNITNEAVGEMDKNVLMAKSAQK